MLSIVRVFIQRPARDFSIVPASARAGNNPQSTNSRGLSNSETVLKYNYWRAPPRRLVALRAAPSPLARRFEPRARGSKLCKLSKLGDLLGEPAADEGGDVGPDDAGTGSAAGVGGAAGLVVFVAAVVGGGGAAAVVSPGGSPRTC